MVPIIQLWTLFLEPLISGKYLGRSHSAEKHVRIALDKEAFESLNTQDKGERLTAATATCHPTGVAGEVAEKLSHTSGPSDGSGRNTVWNFTNSGFTTVGDADTHTLVQIHVHASVLDLRTSGR